MQKLTIGLMAVLCVLLAGATWADKGDRDDRGDRDGWGDRGDRDHRNDKGDKDDFAPVPQTGQVLCYNAAGTQIDCAGTGQDGALQKGVELPTPRFTDKGDGTIKDNLTGLIWLKNANCPNTRRDWQTALNDVASLNTSGKMNGNDCGDTSGKRGTHRTDWRLPNVRELHSLVDFAFFNPAISNAAGTGIGSNSNPFSNFQASINTAYWSSTTLADNTKLAWLVTFNSGDTNVNFAKTDIFNFVFAVRGGS